MIIDHLQQDRETPRIPVVCMYLNYKDSSIQTLVNLMGSLLKQLIQLRGSVFESNDLREFYRKAKRRNAKPKLEQIRKILQTEMAACDRVYCVVDALDECDFRQELISEILSLVPEKLSLLITSRQIDSEARGDSFDCDICGSTGNIIYYHCNICNNGDFDLCISCKEKNLWCRDRSHPLLEPNDSVDIDIRTPAADLERYVHYEISRETTDYGSKSWDTRTHSSRPGMTRFGRKCQKDPDLLKRIPTVVVQKANGRFLYAKLFMDSLKSKQTLRHIRDTLDSFPDEVRDIYSGILQRISDQKLAADRVLGLKTLSRIACAHRPLSLSELQHVLAVEPGSTELDRDLDYDQEEILSSTAGLVTVDSDQNAVRLVHTTLQEYFNQEDNRNRWFPQAEVEMASACLTYLNFDDFGDLGEGEEELDARKEEYPFLAYASQYWGVHVHDAGADPDVRVAAVQLIQEPRRMAAYLRAAWYIDRGSAGWDVRKEVDGLHVCAWFGLSSIVSALDQSELDVDVQETTYGQTPLMYASRAGHVEMVRSLLDLGASVNIVSARGRTALFEAILQNRESVVDVLLNRKDLLINAINEKEYNRTALMLAVRLGHVNIVMSLLQRDDIDVNHQDSSGITALYLATVKGSVYIVHLLLQQPGIDANRGDLMSGRSPLILAAERDNTSIVELLLRNGADPLVKDRQGGGKAMLRAADYGCISVMEMMLEHGVDLRCRDADGRTLLHGASSHGKLDVVRFLRERDLDPNACDKNNFTPLHEASCEGHVEVAKALLDMGANKTLRDRFLRTPFTCAWQYGHVKIMKLLESDDDEDSGDFQGSIPDEEKLPIWSLTKSGLVDLVKKACTARNAGITETEPRTGNTALHWAVLSKQDEILRVLLESGKLSVNSLNAHHRTPLHYAAIQGNMNAVSELLKHKPKLNLQDEWGTTALYLAQSNHQMPVAIALIEAGAEIDVAKIEVQTMFFAAIEMGNIKAVEALIKRGKADVLSRNSEGLTSLQVAKANDDGEMIRLLKISKSFYHEVVVDEKEEEEKESSEERENSMKAMQELMALPSPKDWGIDEMPTKVAEPVWVRS